ncbi:G-protein coupled receptor GRL101-like [Bolinopsis microptera]|uniref:G-protein coupled receptor GRL101-like n=1 Tax=Bolinopsis microptera TaxID=2820187 RepID=UPI003079A135
MSGGYKNKQRFNCNGVLNCENTGIDEQDCDDDNYKCLQQQNFDIPRGSVCDGVCDCLKCDDEAMCDGYRYGMFHTSFYGQNWYLPPNRICNGINETDDGSDEVNCTVLGRYCKTDGRHQGFSLLHGGAVESSVRLLRNDSVCSVPKDDEDASNGDCVDGLDQIDCSDTNIAPLKCQINGTESTVSKYVICRGKDLGLCDNRLDSTCLYPERECRVHKHQVCDGVADCPRAGDEDYRICRGLTNVSCVRRYSYGTTSLPILLEWVGDGLEDCVDGKDEDEDRWKKCGKEMTSRFIKKSDSCKEVLLCPDEKRNGKYPETKGQILDTKTICGEVQIESAEKAFGVQEKKIMLPYLSKTDCRYTFGELYVYYSCSGQCSEDTASCVLRRSLKFNSCANMENRLFTLSGKGNLTIAFKGKDGEYDNSVFPCKNGKCISYDKVCNLQNDCGDYSDESACINHFRCNGTDGVSEYIPLWRVCDGNLDCVDFTDECNDNCRGKEKIIDGLFLSIFTWIIGILATLLNIGTLASIFYQFKQATSNLRIVNLVLVMLIVIGDFLIGVYLIGISIASAVYKVTYCKKRFEWLASSYCQLFGVLSTIGGQLALFAMTILSIVRMVCVRAAIPNYTFSRKMLVVGTVTVSCILLIPVVIAVVPLASSFEDFFVNGWVYLDSMLFIGAPDKSKYISIISAYYHDKIKKPDNFNFSWGQIRNLIEEMFSNDYTGLRHKPLNFYGNHGTCLFKYFVTSDDPQNVYTWTLLGVNLCCFFIICYCYIWIYWKSKSSSSRCNTNKNQTTKQGLLHKKIALMIITDFLCWAPFTVATILHFSGTIDATNWYPFFSSVILPLNSVINPLLYDSNVSTIICRLLNRSSSQPQRMTARNVNITARNSSSTSSLKLVDRGINAEISLGSPKTAQQDV